MATGAIFAQGTQLLMDDGGGVNFTKIAEVRNIAGLGGKTNMIDVTSHDSTGAFMEQIPGIIKGQVITFDVNFQPAVATHGVATGLSGVWKNHLKRTFKVIFTDAGSTNWLQPGYIADLKVKASEKGELLGSISIEPTGAPTIN